jgi:riboflavin synthase
MFTGIVQDVGTLRETRSLDDGQRYRIEHEAGLLDEGSPGSSVAVNGVCLTATELDPDGFWTDVSSESLEKTNLSELEVGRSVNLEPSLRVGDELGGHFVSGHVDTTTEVTALENRGDFHVLTVRVPGEYGPYLAPKGSVTLDGISLTINRVDETEMSIRIVPHTYRETRLQALSTGDRVNLEVDMLARYVYNIVNNDR